VGPELAKDLQEEHEGEVRREFLNNTEEGRVVLAHMNRLSSIIGDFKNAVAGKPHDLSGMDGLARINLCNTFLSSNGIDIDYEATLKDGAQALRANHKLSKYYGILHNLPLPLSKRRDIHIGATIGVRLNPRKDIGEAEGRYIDGWVIQGINARGRVIARGPHPELGEAVKELAVDKIIEDNPRPPIPLDNDQE
jgi:hypothetical protein